MTVFKRNFGLFLISAMVLAPSLLVASNIEQTDSEATEVGPMLSIDIQQSGAVFATRPDYVITHRDMDRFASTIPAEHRAATLASMERLARVVDNISIRLGLAQRAVELGYVNDSEMQAELLHAVAVVLSDAYMENKTAEIELSNYDLMAEELYLNDPLLFNRGDHHVTFEQILVSAQNRTEVDAMTRMLEIHERLDSGQSFESLIPIYSEDPQMESNNGLYENIEVAMLDATVLEHLNMLDPGEISSPFRSPFGWHFVRLIEKIEPVAPDFEAVKEQYVVEARARHLQEFNDSILAEIVEEPINIPEEEIDEFLSRHGADSVDFSSF